MSAPGPVGLQLPRTIGRYRIERWLGAGGMGTVYLGRGPDGEPVAVKVLRADVAADPAARARFEIEAAAARRVAGWCTARLIDADASGPMPYLVSEYVDGETLGEAVRRQGALAPSAGEGVAVGVALALAAIHGAGVVHRDLKPSNILLSPTGPRVVDFGIAVLDGRHAALTALGQVVGSAGWMSPEQVRGLRVTPASDVFSWGTIACYATTGRNPFGDGDPVALSYRVAHTAPDLGGLPPTLREPVTRAMDPDPGRRPTATQLLDALLRSSADLHQRPLASNGAHPGVAHAATELLTRTWQPPPPTQAWSTPAATLVGGGPPPDTRPARPAWYRRRRYQLGLALTALLLLLGSTRGGQQPAPAPSTRAASTTAPSTSAPPSSRAPKSPVTRTARDGGLQFTVRRVQCGARRLGEGWTTADATGMFCVVTMAVRNVDAKPHTLFMVSQQARDAAGNTYAAAGNAWWYHEPSRGWGEINPGLTDVGDLVFDVPAGVTFTELVVRDSPLSVGTVLPLR